MKRKNEFSLDREGKIRYTDSGRRLSESGFLNLRKGRPPAVAGTSALYP